MFDIMKCATCQNAGSGFGGYGCNLSACHYEPYTNYATTQTNYRHLITMDDYDAVGEPEAKRAVAQGFMECRDATEKLNLKYIEDLQKTNADLAAYRALGTPKEIRARLEKCGKLILKQDNDSNFAYAFIAYVSPNGTVFILEEFTSKIYGDKVKATAEARLKELQK